MKKNKQIVHLNEMNKENLHSQNGGQASVAALTARVTGSPHQRAATKKGLNKSGMAGYSLVRSLPILPSA